MIPIVVQAAATTRDAIETIWDEFPPAASTPRPVNGTHLRKTALPECPEPQSLEATGIREERLRDLILNTLARAGSATPRELSESLRLSVRLIDALLGPMKLAGLVEVSGASSYSEQMFNYVLTPPGREQAAQAHERNGYVGPAPIAWDDYVALQTQQALSQLLIEPTAVQDALTDIVLPRNVVDSVGIAVNSAHSLLISGEPGNGKTTIVQAMRRMLHGSVLIPYAVEVAGQTIVLFDPDVHELLPDQDRGIDRRLALCYRPLVTVAGELTLDDLDLQWDPVNNCYGAPPPLKANGGVLVVDDFGRQRVSAHDLLNRWIGPLESRVDQLRLRTGLSIAAPFDALIAFSSNCELRDLGDEAFLRRIRYKIYVPNPTRDDYVSIFQRSCRDMAVAFDEECLRDFIQEFYVEQSREFRGCHPRDLLGIVKNYDEYHGQRPAMTQDALRFAGNVYFGDH